VPARSRVLTLLLLPSLLLLACGDDATDEASPTGSAVESGVTVSTDTSAAPEVEIPDGDPPAELVVEQVVAGDGEPVQAGDLLVADYTGLLWDNGEEFDSSWERGEPTAFGIGVGQVIAGWDQGLVGQDVGSRVLLVIPSDLAYGDDGSPGGIPGGATLVFAVDIRDTFGSRGDLSGTAVDDLPAGLPVVGGVVGTEPSVDVTDADEPAESTSVVVVEGAGDPLEGDTVVAHAVQVSFDTGEVTYTSWGQAPEQLPREALPGLSEALEGAAVGTRVVSLIAADDNSGEALVLVLDVLGAF